MPAELSQSRLEYRRWLALAAASAAACALYTLLPAAVWQNAYVAEWIAQLDHRVWRPLYTVTTAQLLTLEFAIVFLGVAVLQFFLPARPNEKFWSSHVLADWVWAFYAIAITSVVFGVYGTWLSKLVAPLAPYTRVSGLADLPLWLRFVIGLVIADLFFWLAHYVQHKIPFLWQFHAVHHSQTELSFFTDDRDHVMEYVVAVTVMFVPLSMLGIPTPAIVGYALFQRWYARVYHSNLRMNFGPLKYILVTPQSHRFHHTLDPRYQDLNFGRFITLWDWVFRTQATQWNSYPETGIADCAFPMEEKRPSIRLLWLPIIQNFYPLKVLVRSGWQRLTGVSAQSPAVEGTPHNAGGSR